MILRLLVLVIWTILLLAFLATPFNMVSLSLLWPSEYAGFVYHFILFFISAIIGLLCTKYLCSFRIRLIIMIVTGVSLSVVLEVVQVFIPNRTLSVGDILFNAAGLAAGIIVCILLYNNKKTRQLFENTGLS